MVCPRNKSTRGNPPRCSTSASVLLKSSNNVKLALHRTGGIVSLLSWTYARACHNVDVYWGVPLSMSSTKGQGIRRPHIVFIVLSLGCPRETCFCTANYLLLLTLSVCVVSSCSTLASKGFLRGYSTAVCVRCITATVGSCIILISMKSDMACTPLVHAAYLVPGGKHT